LINNRDTPRRAKSSCSDKRAGKDAGGPKVSGRNFVMRRASLITVGAALCVVTAGVELAAASPVATTRGVRPATSASTDSWTDKLKFWEKDAPMSTRLTSGPAGKPTDSISPWRHPISYFSAAMAETPVATAMKNNKPKQTDSISLDTPTGPATPQFYISVAQLAERQGNVQHARNQLQQGLNKWPRDVELLRAAARMEDRQGNLPLAEALYQKAVTIDPQHAGALNDLGLCLARQGKLEQSAQSIEQAINLQPDKALYRNNAATVLVEMRQDQRALAHLSAVHGPAESSFNLGQLLVDRGRPHEAVTHFQRALELEPSMQQAQMAIAQINGVPATQSQIASEPVIQPQNVAPTYGPQMVPQQQVSEPTFPATARGPGFGSSSYVPPATYYPSTPMQNTVAPAAPVYQTATAPRYLPPVRPIGPGSMVR
jgi:tetratricopeptide (TPR) repeat protein